MPYVLQQPIFTAGAVKIGHTPWCPRKSLLQLHSDISQLEGTEVLGEAVAFWSRLSDEGEGEDSAEWRCHTAIDTKVGMVVWKASLHRAERWKLGNVEREGARSGADDVDDAASWIQGVVIELSASKLCRS